MDPKVRALMRSIEKKHPGTIVLGSDINRPMRETITTGSLSFDAALGGGWATNHWAEIIGHESSGKTMLALRTVAANQRRDPNWMTYWVASEDFHEPYARMWGVDMDRVIRDNDTSMEDVGQRVIEAIETKGIDLVVIDSLVGLQPDREIEDEVGASQMGRKALLVGQFLRKANKAMKRSLLDPDERPCTGLIVNQWRTDLGVRFGDPRTAPGGKEKNFWCFQRVDVRRVEWIKNTKQLPVGHRVKIIGIKNKYAPPRRFGELDAYFAPGKGFRAGQIDTIKDYVSAALTFEVVVKDGGSYVFGETRWRGRPGFEAALKDPKLRAQIKKAVLSAAAEPLEAPKQTPRKPRAKR